MKHRKNTLRKMRKPFSQYKSDDKTFHPKQHNKATKTQYRELESMGK